MNEVQHKWRFVFIGIWIALAGMIFLFGRFLGFPDFFNWIVTGGLYLFSGLQFYLLTADIIPLKNFWKITIAWMPALFSETVCTWIVR